MTAQLIVDYPILSLFANVNRKVNLDLNCDTIQKKMSENYYGYLG